VDTDEISNTYILPPDGDIHPRVYFERLVGLPEHVHLKDGNAAVDFLLATDPVIKAGRQVLGMAHLPKVQGHLKGVFTWMLQRTFGRLPDFLITLDREYWEEGDDLDREILMYHEMCHCIHAVDREGELRYDEDGNPVWALRAHDVEEFEATVRRYGPYSPEIRRFIEAAQEGGAR
jgi:hypothetical protein